MAFPIGLAYGIQMKFLKQQKTLSAILGLAIIGLLPGCSAYSKVEFDPATDDVMAIKARVDELNERARRMLMG